MELTYSMEGRGVEAERLFSRCFHSRSGRRCDVGRKFLCIQIVGAGRIDGAIATQLANDVLLLAGVLSGEPGERIGDDVAVVKLLHCWITAHVQPKAMNKLHVVRTQVGSMWSDVEDLCIALTVDHAEVELPLGLGESFPSLTHVK